MTGDTRKLHYKQIKDTADTHVGHKGDIWYDPNTTALRFYNGTPGGELAGSGGGLSEANFLDYGPYANTTQAVAINLAKKYHWLVDLGDGNNYTLADGTQGQELFFFPCLGLDYAGVEQSDLYVDNLKYWDDAGPNSRWNVGPRHIRLFTHNNTTDTCSMIRAFFLNGCWHIDANVEDYGSF